MASDLETLSPKNSIEVGYFLYIPLTAKVGDVVAFPQVWDYDWSAKAEVIETSENSIIVRVESEFYEQPQFIGDDERMPIGGKTYIATVNKSNHSVQYNHNA